MGLLGAAARTAGKLTRQAVDTAAGVGGLAHAAISAPWQVQAGVFAPAAVIGYTLMAHGSPAVQAIPSGPAVNEVAPGMSASKSNFDMGASGDLVFALHRLNH